VALTYRQGTFTVATVTGNQVVDTGSGVVIKALILFGTPQTAEGFTANDSGFISLNSATVVKSITWASDDNLASSNAAMGINNECLRIYSNGTPTTDAIATTVTFNTGADAGKFTINVTDAAGSAWIVHYIALGGTDLTNVFVGSFAAPTATGSRADTGVGFQGDTLITIGANKTALPTNTANIGAGMGAAISSTERGAIRWGNRDAHASNTVHFRSITKCLLIGSANGNGAMNEADFTSFDADGYTLNWTAGTVANIYAVMVLKGLRNDIASILTPAATGNQSFTTTFDQASGGVFFFGTGQTTADATQAAELHVCLGVMGESPLTEGHIWTSSDNAATNDSNKRTVTTKCIGVGVNPATVAAEADAVSLNTDGYTIGWTTVRQNSHFFGLAFAAAAVVAATQPFNLSLTGAGI